MPDKPDDLARSVEFGPIADADWPAALTAMRGGFATKLNVYRVMAHNPALLMSWRDFRNHVVLHNELDAGSLEIVILRTAYRRGSSYEWLHHVARGRIAGLDDQRIIGAAVSPVQAASSADAMLIQCVDALIDTNRLPGDLQRVLLARFGKQGVLDLIATVGMYSLLAYIVESFGTPIDAEVSPALVVGPACPAP